MVSSVGSIQNQAIDLMQQRKSQILEKLKNGDAEEAIVTGGNAFTESVWNKMLEGVDDYLEEVKEEQKVRFAKMDEEQQEKELLQKRLMEKEMQDESKVLSIPLTEGGCLKVNRDNISDLAKSISMFSPEDICRIMEAIATDAKYQQMQQEMDETLNSISASTTIASKAQAQSGDEVTAEQIAELFAEREE